MLWAPGAKEWGARKECQGRDVGRVVLSFGTGDRKYIF